MGIMPYDHEKESTNLILSAGRTDDGVVLIGLRYVKDGAEMASHWMSVNDTKILHEKMGEYIVSVEDIGKDLSK